MRQLIKKIFIRKNDEKQILLSVINELKADKERLQKQNDYLFEQVNSIINNINKSENQKTKSRLTPKEEKIYSHVLMNPNISFKELVKFSKITPGSLRVVMTNIRRKGFTISLN